MNIDELKHNIQKLTTQLSPNFKYSSSCVDEGSYINFHWLISENMAIEMNIDFMDMLITFFFIRLDAHGKPYEVGYYANPNVGTIRLYFNSILKFLNIPFEKKKYPKSTFTKKDVVGLLENIKASMMFYSYFFENSDKIAIVLADTEVWEQIKRN